MAKNKKWSSGLKFEIVLQVLKGEATVNEICKRYDVAPSQLHAWKKQFLEQGSQVFSKTDKAATITDDAERTQRTLYEKIGQLTVERDFLKKAWSKLHGNSDEN